MAVISFLPTEILQDIVSRLSPGYEDILNLRLACRAFWEVTASVLYRDINLNFSGQDTSDDGLPNDTTLAIQKRQLQLLQTVSRDPRLGGYVKSFTNHEDNRWSEEFDATTNKVDASTLIAAAKNMTNISKAALNPSYLSAHLIANLQDYPQLKELSVHLLEPIEHIWPMALTSLTRLKWAFEGEFSFLLKVVEITCPNLESLEIDNTLQGVYQVWSDIPPYAEDTYHQYSTDKAPTGLTSALKHLHHFGLQYSNQHFEFRYRNNTPEIQASYLSFVGIYRHTLKSLILPVEYDQGRNGLEFLAKVLVLLPELQGLELAFTRTKNKHRDAMDGLEFCKELTAALTKYTPSLEKFSTTNIGCSFTGEVGKLFEPLQNLKFLQVGDLEHAEGSTWGDAKEGFFDIWGYQEKILEFVAELPKSLEELYIEVHAIKLLFDEPTCDVFDTFCDEKRKIFSRLRRLHSLDFHIWHPNRDGPFTRICPEKAVMLRRLSHRDPESSHTVLSDRVKDIWKSSMNIEFQDELRPTVTQECETMDLGIDEDNFEGPDAKEVWCKGFASRRHWMEEGFIYEEPGMNERWPGYEHLVNQYPRFRSYFWQYI